MNKNPSDDFIIPVTDIGWFARRILGLRAFDTRYPFVIKSLFAIFLAVLPFALSIVYDRMNDKNNEPRVELKNNVEPYYKKRQDNPPAKAYPIRFQ
jgi:hypothetical protein